PRSMAEQRCQGLLNHLQAFLKILPFYIRRNHGQAVFPALRDRRTEMLYISLRRILLDIPHIEGMPMGGGVRQDWLPQQRVFVGGESSKDLLLLRIRQLGEEIEEGTIGEFCIRALLFPLADLLGKEKTSGCPFLDLQPFPLQEAGRHVFVHLVSVVEIY